MVLNDGLSLQGVRRAAVITAIAVLLPIGESSAHLTNYRWVILRRYR